MPPQGGDRASQIEAMWALIFYLGSVVRYRPHRFEITNGHYGPFADEFIAVQAEQLLYLLASEICRRAISRPAII
ncbi:MAG: YaaC family protein [Solirubrobacteraceae bacterium]